MRITQMNKVKTGALSAAAAGLFFAAISSGAQAQISVTIDAAPDCPYGYYDEAPYSCAPYGYYGPEWFSGGAFVGAGRWYHGPANFHGNVNNQYDARRGYKGPMPNRGDRAEESKRPDKVASFKGNEVRDGRGNGGDRR
jgi:hypothetical protein